MRQGCESVPIVYLLAVTFAAAAAINEGSAVQFRWREMAMLKEIFLEVGSLAGIVVLLLATMLATSLA